MRRDYTRLGQWLHATDRDHIPMTFEEVGRLVDSCDGERGVGLPESAFKYPQWWENDDYHSQSREWQGAGYRTAETDLGSRTVCFVRSTTT